MVGAARTSQSMTSLSGRPANASVTTPSRGASAPFIDRLPQRTRTIVDRRLCGVEPAQIADEAVDHSVESSQLHPHAGFFQPPCVPLALVDPRVVLRGEEESRPHAGRHAGTE